LGTFGVMATADAIEQVVIVHEPTQRYIGAGFVLCEAPERAIRFTDERIAERVIARHASEPVYSTIALREALAA